MKKILRTTFLFVIISFQLSFLNLGFAQGCYWVVLKDKAGTTFDPYSYFDAKAIERYRLVGADLYDVSNYPLNQEYVLQINAIASEEVGQSRWLNAVAVMASSEQVAAIEKLPFVERVDMIASSMEVASDKEVTNDCKAPKDSKMSNEVGMMVTADYQITDQLLRMQGEQFVEKGIDGTGVRIAVFDGGFHAVNTHQAFKHLRDNRLIKATWDFTKKQEFVYDNHTHGTMVLSCIAGRLGNKLLGLATGAEFLLAKTEVEPEPFKEEVWWTQAAEWADKNGADIINSSLGYTKDRHYTWEMDGRSYVAKAANMAAGKGILVCNSAGNSGSDDNWKIIGTPADADSILSVGGIAPSLTTYQHISFSSYGPTSDGRMKPNVSAFGYAECADPHNDTATEFAAGTSFSSPLTAGFCACAWQLMKGKLRNAQQMKHYVEKSSDLYPYYDYAFGFGVPQASYFLDESKQMTEPAATFLFEDRGKFVLIHPTALRKNTSLQLDFQTKELKDEGQENVVMFKIQDRKGLVERYVNLGSSNFDESTRIAISKAAIYGYELVVHVNGFTNSYRLSKLDSIYYAGKQGNFEYYVIDTNGLIKNNYRQYGNRTLKSNSVSNWGFGQKYNAEVAFQVGLSVGNDDQMKDGFGAHISVRFTRNFRKWYALGVGLDFGGQTFLYDKEQQNRWDASLGLGVGSNVKRKEFELLSSNIELFQRISIVKGGKVGKGLHWDLGVYGGLQGNNYYVLFDKNATPNANSSRISYEDVKPADKVFNWGLTTRLAWNWIGVYGRFRMSQPDLGLPRLELGLQFVF